MNRREDTRKVRIGDVVIGGGNPVRIQSVGFLKSDDRVPGSGPESSVHLCRIIIAQHGQPALQVLHVLASGAVTEHRLSGRSRRVRSQRHHISGNRRQRRRRQAHLPTGFPDGWNHLADENASQQDQNSQYADSGKEPRILFLHVGFYLSSRK